jgi:hypothetical protein
MSEQQTPETDAHNNDYQIGGFTLDFCRRLERERDEARIAYAVVVDAMVVEQSAHRETRNQCDNLATLLGMIRNEYAEWRVEPECDCDECSLLGPIDNALATLKEQSHD